MRSLVLSLHLTSSCNLLKGIHFALQADEASSHPRAFALLIANKVAGVLSPNLYLAGSFFHSGLSSSVTSLEPFSIHFIWFHLLFSCITLLIHANTLLPTTVLHCHFCFLNFFFMELTTVWSLKLCILSYHLYLPGMWAPWEEELCFVFHVYCYILSAWSSTFLLVGSQVFLLSE